MRLSARKVNRLMQHSDKRGGSWYSSYYGPRILLFLATLEPALIKDKRMYIRITKKELANRMHFNMYDLTRVLGDLVEEGRLRKETGYDTVNIYVSLPVSFLYDDE
jgi:DNA-binding MarR family transcriptional regulator